jgi:hypothetical protein
MYDVKSVDSEMTGGDVTVMSRNINLTKPKDSRTIVDGVRNLEIDETKVSDMNTELTPQTPHEHLEKGGQITSKDELE